MKQHKLYCDCPRCGGPLVLTTEWGWVDDETATAVVCCPDCRTEPEYAEVAVVACHHGHEDGAVQSARDHINDLRSAIRSRMETLGEVFTGH